MQIIVYICGGILYGVILDALHSLLHSTIKEGALIKYEGHVGYIHYKKPLQFQILDGKENPTYDLMQLRYVYPILTEKLNEL